MAFLKTVLEHGSVLFFQHVFADFNDKIRANAEDVCVKSSVVDFAEREPVGDPRLALGMPVRQYVRGVEKERVSQSADCTALPVGIRRPGVATCFPDTYFSDEPTQGDVHIRRRCRNV